MAVRIAATLKGPDADMWLPMQANFDAWQAERKIDISHILPIAKTTNLRESPRI